MNKSDIYKLNMCTACVQIANVPAIDMKLSLIIKILNKLYYK